MTVLIVLFGSWLILRGIGALGVTALATWHDSVRYALAVLGAAGLLITRFRSTH